MISKTKNARDNSRFLREIILIILVFILLVFAIWRWFDYRIARLQFGVEYSSINTSLNSEQHYESL